MLPVYLLEREYNIAPQDLSQDYEAWVEKIGLPSLTYRRERRGTIETFKCLHGLYTDDSSHNASTSHNSRSYY
jgi:hypothetical protein